MHTRMFARIFAAVAMSTTVMAAEQQPAHFDLAARDFARAEELAKQLAALSPRVNPGEAKLLSEYA
jgi:hypothetical protein